MANQADADNETLDIKSVGVIGAGQMGGGIAHVCALAGLDVALSDISAEQIESALANIAQNMDRHVQALVTVCCFIDGKAVIPETRGHALPEGGFVLDDQDAHGFR